MFTSALGTGLSTLIDANPSFDAMCMFLILITTRAGRIGIAGPSDGGERMQGFAAWAASLRRDAASPSYRRGAKQEVCSNLTIMVGGDIPWVGIILAGPQELV